MRTICVSLPVRNLAVSKAFFAELGFTFSRECSGEGTACIIVDRNIYVMLVAEDRFRDAVDGEIRGATAGAGLVTGRSAGSAREVDETVAKAIAMGGKPWPIMEERPVCSGSFQDLDGHVWQLTYSGAGKPAAEMAGLASPAH
jgi:predicted lactoylglutathione lyase